MSTRSLEEPYLLGLHLGQIAWGRLAGVPPDQLKRVENVTQLFLGRLGLPSEAANRLSEVVRTASGKPRTLTSAEILQELGAFRQVVTEDVVRRLSQTDAAALRLGFGIGIATAFASLGVESPKLASAPLQDVLTTLAPEVKSLNLLQWQFDTLRHVAAQAPSGAQCQELSAAIGFFGRQAQATLRGVPGTPPTSAA